MQDGAVSSLSLLCSFVVAVLHISYAVHMRVDFEVANMNFDIVI